MGFTSRGNPSFLFFFFFLCLSTVSAYINNTSSNNGEARRELASGRCNWFRGNWVYDAKYPLYDPYKCPFIDPQFNCKKYGRPDNAYLKFRWQPSSCSLPRFLLSPYLLTFFNSGLFLIQEISFSCVFFHILDRIIICTWWKKWTFFFLCFSVLLSQNLFFFLLFINKYGKLEIWRVLFVVFNAIYRDI